MKITDVRVKKIEDQVGKVKAMASITFDEEFVVHGLRVIEGTDGLFVVMPSRKTPNGEYKDIAHPLVQPVREAIEKAVIDAYNKAE